MEQPIKKNCSYFARSRLRLRPQEIWERDYVPLGQVTLGTRLVFPATKNNSVEIAYMH